MCVLSLHTYPLNIHEFINHTKVAAMYHHCVRAFKYFMQIFGDDHFFFLLFYSARVFYVTPRYALTRLIADEKEKNGNKQTCVAAHVYVLRF